MLCVHLGALGQVGGDLCTSSLFFEPSNGVCRYFRCRSGSSTTAPAETAEGVEASEATEVPEPELVPLAKRDEEIQEIQRYAIPKHSMYV